MRKYVEPVYNCDKFTCPLCETLSSQQWKKLYSGRPFHALFGGGITQIRSPKYEGISICKCLACNEDTIWYQENMVHPESSTAPHPSEDMPRKIQEVYEEARAVYSKSPKAATALLRVTIEELIKISNVKGKTLNDKIKNLVKSGLPESVRKALDIVRIIGNNAVHPGNINLKDDSETAMALFELVNLVNNYLIRQSKMIEKIYAHLPEGAKKGIEKRDEKK